MTQQEILDFNKRCAEFLGANIFEDENRWYVRNWKNPEHNPNKIVSSTPITIWGTKEDTYNKILSEQLNEIHGRWGKFHLDWNWIMEVVEAINMIPNSKNPSDTTLQTKRTNVQSILRSANKKAVVQAINQFLIWYNENNIKKT